MENLKGIVKEWVKLEEETAELKKKIKELSQNKKKLSDHLLSIMKEKQIDEFDLNSDGKLLRKTRKTTQPINKKQLLACLTTYYDNTENAHKVTDYILSSRQKRLLDVLCKK